jgi:hypothetical protein
MRVVRSPVWLCALVLAWTGCDQLPLAVDGREPVPVTHSSVPEALPVGAEGPVPGPLSTTSPEAGPPSDGIPAGDPSTGKPIPLAAAGAVAASAGAGPDLVWQRPGTGETTVWHGTRWQDGFTALQKVPVGWEIAGAGDFTGNGSPDLVWQHSGTGDRSIWHMDGRTWTGSFTALPRVAADWRIAAVADFTGNGTPDLVWQHNVTGDRSIWHMNGTGWTGSFTLLPRVATAWRIAGAGDFNGNDWPDLVWENTSTGQRSLWLMQGTSVQSYAMLPVVVVDWRIAGVADFNADGKVDLVWQNIVTGQRSIWFMNGVSFPGNHLLLQTVDPSWRIATIRIGFTTPDGVIVVGDTIEGSIRAPGDVNVYTFDGSAGQEVNLFLQALPGSDRLRIQVFRRYGEIEQALVTSVSAYASTDLHAYHSGRLTLADEEYTVLVHGYWSTGTGDYRFQVFPIDREPEIIPSQIAVGDTVAGEMIFPKGDIDVFTFSGNEGQAINIFFQPLDGSSRLSLQLIHRYGEIEQGVLTAFSAYESADLHHYHSGRLTLPADDTYAILVQGHWADGTGDYRFQIFPVDRAPENIPSQIVIGDTIVGEAVFPKGDIDVFSFTGGAGQEINLFFQPLGNSDRLYIELVEHYGTPFESRITNFSAYASADLHAYHSGRLALPRDDTYTIIVRGHWADGTGPYRFQVFPIDRAPELIPSQIAVGDTITGEAIFPRGDVDEFTFTGFEGQEINLFFQPLSGSNSLRVWLFDRYGEAGQTQLTWFTGHATSDLHQYHSGRLALPRNGTYTIVIEGTHSGDTGSYRFQVFPINRAPEHIPSQVAIGDTIVGETIFPKGDVDEFTFTGSQGQQVEVFLMPYGGSDGLHLAVYDQYGTESEQLLRSRTAYNTSNLEQYGTGTFTLPRNGTYTMVVRGASSGSTGQYLFHIRPQ